MTENRQLILERAELKRQLKAAGVSERRAAHAHKKEVAQLTKELDSAKGYHESAAKEAKLFGYKSLGQLSKFYGVTAETLQTYHKKDRNRFVDIMKQCEFKLGDNTCQL